MPLPFVAQASCLLARRLPASAIRRQDAGGTARWKRALKIVSLTPTLSRGEREFIREAILVAVDDPELVEAAACPELVEGKAALGPSEKRIPAARRPVKRETKRVHSFYC